jgi:Helix-turn-helix of DDE superfamily endonuclease
MAGLRFSTIESKPYEILDLTSLTLDEFQILVAPFEVAFQDYMREWRLDGKPRTARSYTTYTNCPLPQAEDRLLFILVYLKTNPLQVAHGRMFGMPQNKANQWIHVLLPVLRSSLRTLGDAPARSLVALTQRLAIALTDLGASAPGSTESPPLFVTMVPSDASHAPKTHLNRKAAIAARKNVIR